MSVKLSKGQKVELTKGRPSLTKLIIGLGWDTNKYDGENDFDLDASAFLLGSNKKVTNETDFVFYHNLEHPTKAVIHMGDNRTGNGDGDDEEIKVDLSKVLDEYEKIAITATIYDADVRSQCFGMVANAYIRIIDEPTGEELLRYDLSEDYSTETAIVFGELYKHVGEWKFNAVGSGFNGGLGSLCRNFGIDVE